MISGGRGRCPRGKFPATGPRCPPRLTDVQTGPVHCPVSVQLQSYKWSRGSILISHSAASTNITKLPRCCATDTGFEQNIAKMYGLISPTEGGLMFCAAVFNDFCPTNYLNIYTAPIFTRFTELVELLPSINYLKLVSRSPKRRCRGNQFRGPNPGQSTQLSSRDIRYDKKCNCCAGRMQTN